MTTWLAVILGGAVGTAARHAVNIVVARVAGAPSPLATAAVNLIGSFLAGILAGALASGRLVMTPATRTFVFVGILGGFTTFSSFMLDSLTPFARGDTSSALLNLLGQLALGFALVYIGFRLGPHVWMP